MMNKLMMRLFAGVAVALLVLAGLSTPEQVMGDPPSGWATCIAAYGCSSSSCPAAQPCTGNCTSCSGGTCICAWWPEESKCTCGIGDS